MPKIANIQFITIKLNSYYINVNIKSENEFINYDNIPKISK